MTAVVRIWNPHLSPGFTQALSTVKSPVFSDIVVIYEDDIYMARSPTRNPHLEITKCLHSEYLVFDRLHQMREILDFKLVLCADVWSYARERLMKQLERSVSGEREQRRLGSDFSQVSVTSIPRRSGCTYRDPLHPSHKHFWRSDVVPPL